MPLPRYLDPATLERLGSLEIAARRVVDGVRVGLHKSPLRGFSTEFAHHRPYVPGDPIRHVDWRVYARSGRYHLKLFEAETDLAATLVLDASASMRYGSGETSKLDFAKYLLASLAHVVVSQRDAVSLVVFDGEVSHHLAPSSAQDMVLELARTLETIEPRPKTGTGRVLEELADRVSRRGIVIVASDLLGPTDELSRGLDRLSYRGHDVTVFQILDPYERTFPFDGTCRFVGLEDRDELTTSPRRIRDAYLRELEVFLSDVKRACAASGVDRVDVDSSEAVDRVISRHVLRRSGRAS